MNVDQLEDKWDQVKAKVKTKWGKLTNDDIVEINGKKDQLINKLVKYYDYTESQARKEVSSFVDKCNCK